MELSGIHEQFPMLNESLIYFDSAATAQKPMQVIDAIRNFYCNDYGTVHRAVYELATRSTEQYQRVREKVANFLSAKSSDEIVFTRGTTEAINLVASSFGKAFVQPGDEILISEVEHHSNIVPWQLMCEERAAHLKVISVNDHGEIDMEAFQELLSEKTKLISVGHISNSLGTIHSIQEIVKQARTVGAKVLVDGAQSAPYLPIDVQELDVDFYAFSGHKVYGPTGVGVLYSKKELLEQLPPYQGGGDMIEKVDFSGTTFQPPPLRFEAGTPPIAQVIGLGAAIDFIDSIGKETIVEHGNQLLEYATTRFNDILDVKIIGTAKNKGPIISFVVDGIHHLDLGTLLDLKGVAIRTGHHCTQPAMKRFGISGTARVSFGIYNTKNEVDRFFEKLSQVIQKLKK